MAVSSSRLKWLRFCVELALCILATLFLTLAFLQADHPLSFIHSPYLVVASIIAGLLLFFEGWFTTLLEPFILLEQPGNTSTFHIEPSLCFLSQVLYGISISSLFPKQIEKGSISILAIFCSIAIIGLLIGSFYGLFRLFAKSEFPVVEFLLKCFSFIGTIFSAGAMYFEDSLYPNATLKRLLIVLMCVITADLVLELHQSYKPKLKGLYSVLHHFCSPFVTAVALACFIDAIVNQGFSFMTIFVYLYVLVYGLSNILKQLAITIQKGDPHEEDSCD